MQNIKTRQYQIIGKLKVVKLKILLTEVLLSMEITELGRITYNQCIPLPMHVIISKY